MNMIARLDSGGGDPARSFDRLHCNHVKNRSILIIRSEVYLRRLGVLCLPSNKLMQETSENVILSIKRFFSFAIRVNNYSIWMNGQDNVNKRRTREARVYILKAA